MIREELETAILPKYILEINKESIVTSYIEQRKLWAFHDSHDVDITVKYLNNRIQLSQVNQVCQEWSSLKWRWNGLGLRDLYQNLRQVESDQKEDKNENNIILNQSSNNLHNFVIVSKEKP